MKAIYEPTGRAGEYAELARNFNQVVAVQLERDRYSSLKAVVSRGPQKALNIDRVVHEAADRINVGEIGSDVTAR
jgi:hypothetical protein